MNYITGEKIKLGDFVRIGGGMSGIVVYDYEKNEFYPEFYSWSTLGCGVLVKSEKAGIIHYPEPDIDLDLIKRRCPI